MPEGYRGLDRYDARKSVVADIDSEGLMIKVEEMGDRIDEQFVLDLLETSNVLVVHGSGFGCDPKAGYFRLVYLPDEQLLGAAFDGIERSLRARAAII